MPRPQSGVRLRHPDRRKPYEGMRPQSAPRPRPANRRVGPDASGGGGGNTFADHGHHGHHGHGHERWPVPQGPEPPGAATPPPAAADALRRPPDDDRHGGAAVPLGAQGGPGGVIQAAAGWVDMSGLHAADRPHNFEAPTFSSRRKLKPPQPHQPLHQPESSLRMESPARTGERRASSPPQTRTPVGQRRQRQRQSPPNAQPLASASASPGHAFAVAGGAARPKTEAELSVEEVTREIEQLNAFLAAVQANAATGGATPLPSLGGGVPRPAVAPAPPPPLPAELADAFHFWQEAAMTEAVFDTAYLTAGQRLIGRRRRYRTLARTLHGWRQQTTLALAADRRGIALASRLRNEQPRLAERAGRLAAARAEVEARVARRRCLVPAWAGWAGWARGKAAGRQELQEQILCGHTNRARWHSSSRQPAAQPAAAASGKSFKAEEARLAMSAVLASADGLGFASDSSDDEHDDGGDDAPAVGGGPNERAVASSPHDSWRRGDRHHIVRQYGQHQATQRRQALQAGSTGGVSKRAALLLKHSNTSISRMAGQDSESSDSDSDGAGGRGGGRTGSRTGADELNATAGSSGSSLYRGDSPSQIIANRGSPKRHSPGKRSIHMQHHEARRAFGIMYGR
eukprot:SAG22_NODE_421_length_10720_cov_22.582619_7_plen_629_part_00